MRYRSAVVVGALLSAAAVAFLPAAAKGGRDQEPEVVVVQHVLIGYKKTVPGKQLDRTRKEAEALAQEVLAKAQAGEDFDALIAQYTDESNPSTIRMTNRGAPLMAQSYPRGEMAMYFGDVAFSLEVGEVGLARQHAAHSPYGFHVIKRIE